MIFLIIFAVVGIVIPVIGSVVICVPKWYEQMVIPRLPAAPGWWDWEPDGTAWYIAPFRLTIVLLALPFFLIAMVIAKYWFSVMSLIERACPYTFLTLAQLYDSQSSQAARFRGVPAKGLVGLWNFLLGK